jgi:hypothetical protein
MRFWENRSQSDIAQHIGTCQMQVSRLLGRAVTHIRRVLDIEPSADALMTVLPSVGAKTAVNHESAVPSTVPLRRGWRSWHRRRTQRTTPRPATPRRARVPGTGDVAVVGGGEGRVTPAGVGVVLVGSSAGGAT